MNLSPGVDSNLVTGSDGQTRVVSGTVVHETFAGRRISLLVNCALERNLLGNSGLEIPSIRLFINKKNVWRLRARGNIGTGSRKAMLYVGAGEGFRVERLDVKDNRDDVQFQPEAGAKIGCLEDARR